MIKIDKKDLKAIVEQSKAIIEQSERNKEVAKEAIRLCNIDIVTAKAIIKNLSVK